VGEKDIISSISNDVRSIQISDTLKTKLCKPWVNTVIIRLLGKSIGYSYLCHRLKSMWKPMGSMHIVDIDRDCFLVKFSCEQDYFKALTAGPWKVEYENIPALYFECGKIGHNSDACPRLQRQITLAPESEMVAFSPPMVGPESDPAPPPEGFGPWMMVSRKHHRQRKDGNQKRKADLEGFRSQIGQLMRLARLLGASRRILLPLLDRRMISGQIRGNFLIWNNLARRKRERRQRPPLLLNFPLRKVVPHPLLWASKAICLESPSANPKVKAN
ncbi:hypothetical protein LINPERHAP1_LOCUS41896, partial [Linum perenne]